MRLYLVPHFKNIPIDDINKAMVSIFLRDLEGVKSGELASETIQAKDRDTSRHMLRFAVEVEDILPLGFEFTKITKPKQELFSLESEGQNQECYLNVI